MYAIIDEIKQITQNINVVLVLPDQTSNQVFMNLK
jgi:hypothetical protein